MSDRCPDCGRPINDGDGCAAQLMGASDDDLVSCQLATIDRLRSRIAQLEARLKEAADGNIRALAIMAAQAKALGHADSLTMLHRAARMAGLETPALDAYDAAKAELERVKGG